MRESPLIRPGVRFELVPGMHACFLLRSIKRHQGGEPAPLQDELAWIDDRSSKLVLDGDGDPTFYWLQTPAPPGSPTA